MYIERIYTGCLSEAAYYIESDGEAAIVDPMRDIELYLDLAKTRGATIKYVIETHFHADFVSGHLDLAKKTGAKIIFGPGAEAGYDIYEALDGEVFHLGSVILKVLHTPGHTLESSCFLLLDERHNPHSVFTGDTLFVGEVGRPDLAVSSQYTKEQLAGLLYDSISSKLLPLPNYVIVYPGHGAGSACGKTIGADEHSTIGIQKQTNYALKAKSKNEFIKLVTDGLSAPPKYFFKDAAINRQGYKLIDDVMKENCKALSVEEVNSLSEKLDVIILDTRPGEKFASGFVPGSINIGLDGSYAVIAGTVLDPDKKLVVVADEGREREAILRLARVGYENVSGYLEGGFPAWREKGFPTDSLQHISAEDFADRFRYNSCIALDVRNSNEWVPGFIAGAKLIALPELEENISKLDSSKIYFIYCASGYRSMVAASILKKHGFQNVINVDGGMIKIRKTTISIKQLSSLNG